MKKFNLAVGLYLLVAVAAAVLAGCSKSEEPATGAQPTTFADWLDLAQKGRAEAQYNVGLMYLSGQGVAKDARAAVGWLAKAAVQNDADAQFNLGALYAKGEGVEKNEVEAARWFGMAAKNGHVAAQNNLGFA